MSFNSVERREFGTTWLAKALMSVIRIQLNLTFGVVPLWRRGFYTSVQCTRVASGWAGDVLSLIRWEAGWDERTGWREDLMGSLQAGKKSN